MNMYIPQLCSWCYLVATIPDGIPQVALSTAAFAYGYCGARMISFAFFHQDVYCSLFVTTGEIPGK